MGRNKWRPGDTEIRRSTLPLDATSSLLIASEHSHHLPKLLKLHTSERLGESIGKHDVGRAIDNGDFAARNSLANEMVLDVDVFGPGVISLILRELDRALVVAVESRRG